MPPQPGSLLQSDAAPMRDLRPPGFNPSDSPGNEHPPEGCRIKGRTPPVRKFPGDDLESCCLTGAWIAAVLVFLTGVGPVHGAVSAVGPVRITVGSLDEVLPFYTDTLEFTHVGTVEEQGQALEQLTGIPGAHTRVATLRLGSETIELVDWLNTEGRPVPVDSRSFDHWFQHIAIVVSDMERAYDRLRQRRVKHVSTGPQTLPEWNPNAGGIKAFYFRDPEDHVLEIIWFPKGKGDHRWQQQGGPLFLGIDHTAVVVADTERSLAFYRDQLGLRVAGASENHGSEQEHLNQVFGARLRITGLRADQGPGIEFLEYLTPPGGRPIPSDRQANDLTFWMVRLADRSVQRPEILFDPDGHALLTVAPAP